MGPYRLVMCTGYWLYDCLGSGTIAAMTKVRMARAVKDKNRPDIPRLLYNSRPAKGPMTMAKFVVTENIQCLHRGAKRG